MPGQGDNREFKPDGRIDAAIFDMDGVVTDTADAHAAAWKRLFDEYLGKRAEASGACFQPFDPDSDYRQYVDGKPRYDGVRSFLDARGIELPRGDPEDGPRTETVCGLGNRKNGYFNAWLEENGVRTYPSTVALIRRLRETGVATGVFSSSRNAETVLRAAGVDALFDARVDGTDLERLDIPGKPDPAMLRETARRLNSHPDATAVFEDAISGVTAGAAGGFALVVGIDRDDYGDALAAHGADVVVHDLGELAFDPERGFRIKTIRDLPGVWDNRAVIPDSLEDREIVVLLDYDGTLTPIVEDFRRAFLDDDMRDALRCLADRCTVGVISGRDLPDLKRLVGLDGILYAGSHGFDIELPGEARETLAIGEKFLPDLDEAERKLEQDLRDVDGSAVERKRFAIAVHYRRVADRDVGRVEAAVDGVVGECRRLHKSYGKKVFQVQPRIDWHKGRAVDWLLDRLDLKRQAVLPFYVGDDLTDEDAFRMLSGSGIGICVGDEDRPTAADYRLDGPDDVRRFLRLLADAVDGGA